MQRKYKLYFANKTCDICKKKASMFRITKNNSFMLCNGQKCEFLSRIKAGLYEGLNIK